MTTSPQPKSEPTLTDILKPLDDLSDDIERSNDKFDTYQKATQWVVQLAFTLIASATVTVILSSVFRSQHIRFGAKVHSWQRKRT